MDSSSSARLRAPLRLALTAGLAPKPKNQQAGRGDLHLAKRAVWHLNKLAAFPHPRNALRCDLILPCMAHGACRFALLGLIMRLEHRVHRQIINKLRKQLHCLQHALRDAKPPRQRPQGSISSTMAHATRNSAKENSHALVLTSNARHRVWCSCAPPPAGGVAGGVSTGFAVSKESLVCWSAPSLAS
ncbi:hypothetical protein GQ54DRAFT_133611 [Martensiomyces pterosporus]|nr:hypothetical protein GQ54DRAFT_133611 [Martensiomyces pterosporus]